MNAMDTQIVVDAGAVVTAVLMGIAGIVSAFGINLARKVKVESEARKTAAEADAVSVNAAEDVIGMLRAEVSALRQRVEALEAQVKAERALTNEANIKYHQALDRIVELEAEVRTLRREASEAKLELEKCRQFIEREENGR